MLVPFVWMATTPDGCEGVTTGVDYCGSMPSFFACCVKSASSR
jgi:hypothetical protein